MTQTTAVEPGGTAPLSTTLDPNTVALESGGGRPDLSKPDPSTDLGKETDKGKDAAKKPVSVRETLDAENARLKAEADTKAKEAADAAKVKADEGKEPEKGKDAEAKAKEAEKAADKSRGPDGKFAPKADENKAPEADKGAPDKAAAGQGGQEPSQSEGRKHAEPPARFLPEARTKWANVPNEVKAEVHRLSQEYEGEIEKHKQASERYEPVRQFDEIARSNGRELKDSLTRVVQVEQALARNPVAGLEMILREIGPRKADGSPLSLYDIAQAVAKTTPQQFAQTMHAALSQPQRPHGGQQQLSPEVQQMAQEMKALRTEIAVFKTQPLIETFKASHPDYDAIEPRIAEVLKSGVVEQLYGKGLSPEQRLSEAYRMAGGSSPSHPAPEAAAANSAADPAPPVNPEAGKKSVRGAPNGGEDTEVERPKQSIRDLLKNELRAASGG